MLKQHPNLATGILSESGKKKYLLCIEAPLPFFYLLYAYENSFTVSIGDKLITCTKDQGILINKSQLFSVILDWNAHGLEREDIYALQITPSIVSDFNTAMDRDFNSLKQITRDKKTIDSTPFVFFDFSKNNNKKSNERKLIFRTMLKSCTLFQDEKINRFYVLNELITNNPSTRNITHAKTTESTVERVAHLIMSDYSVHLTAYDLANKLSISQSTLKKRLKKEGGTLSSLTNKIKLTESLRLLRRTNISLTQIALSLGYSSSSHFSKKFKQHFKLSPSEIRKNQNAAKK